jgi:hypothetical protein
VVESVGHDGEVPWEAPAVGVQATPGPGVATHRHPRTPRGRGTNGGGEGRNRTLAQGFGVCRHSPVLEDLLLQSRGARPQGVLEATQLDRAHLDRLVVCRFLEGEARVVLPCGRGRGRSGRSNRLRF